MINANELRIGNLVLYNDKFQKIYGIETEGFITEFNLLGIRTTQIEPIPLTPEILEKAGFVVNENYDNHRIQINEYFYSVKKVEGKWYLFNDSSDASCYILTELKYLHQLQNIIFALEHIELPIEP